MDTILAYGATGECVVKLTALARAAGINIPQKTDNQLLDGQEINTILEALGLADAGERPAPAGALYKGLVVDQRVWDALRAAAAANTGLTVPTPAGQGAPATVVPVAPAGGQPPASSTAAAPGTETPSPQGAGATP